MPIIFAGLKALPFTLVVVIVCGAKAEAFKAKLQARQVNLCANHAMGDFVENPEDCKLFVWCGDNGEAVPASCPSDMLFNPISKLCDTADNVICQSKVVVTAPAAALQVSTSAPNTASDTSSNANQFCYNVYSQQPASNALVFIANPHNCYQYYMCYHGQALSQECSTNLYWNAKIGKCDLPENVNCLPPVDDTNSIQISPPVGQHPTLDDDSVCPLYGHHIFPHMERCDFFIYCVKGYAILQKCPFFHYFDVESARCKWRTSALCVKDLKLKFRKNTF